MVEQREATDQKERYWREHIACWERSGLTQREYCKQQRLAFSTFQLWRRRLAAANTQPPLDIVPVVHAPRALLFPQAVALVIDGGRYRVEIGDGVRVETLRVVLEALETR